LQCVAVWASQENRTSHLKITATHCNTLQRTVAHCNRILHLKRQSSQKEPIYCIVLQWVAACCSVRSCAAACCSVLQCVTMCCSGLQCVAACCSVLSCAEVREKKSPEKGSTQHIPVLQQKAGLFFTRALCMFLQIMSYISTKRALFLIYVCNTQ